MTKQSSIESNLELLYQKCVSAHQKTNFISTVHRSFFYNDEPKLYTFILNSKNSSKKFQTNASGSAWDERLAFIKGYIEMIERYALIPSVNDLASLVLSSQEKLPDSIGLDKFMKFSPEQLSDKTFSQKIAKSTDPLYWVKATNLATNKSSLIPAQTVFCPFGKKEKIIRTPISTGASAGLDKEATIIRAILEVLERDTFISAYLGQLPGTVLNLTNPSGVIADLLNEFNFYLLKPIIIKLDNDYDIPVILTILLDQTKNKPIVTLGLKCHTDLSRAIQGSLEESFHTRGWMRDELAKSDEKYIQSLIKNIDQTFELKDRGLIWSQPFVLKYINFWLDNKKTANLTLKPNYPKIVLQKLIKKLGKVGFDIYLKEFSDSEIKKLGFYTCKIVIPQAQPLYLEEEFKYLETSRIEKIAKHKINNLNPFLQPFL